MRISDGHTLLAYSGDTEWTETLLAVAVGPTSSSASATAMPASITGHLSWDILKPRLPDLRARRIMVTHMNPTMLAHLDEVRAAGVLVAEDGAVIEI